MMDDYHCRNKQGYYADEYIQLNLILLELFLFVIN